jgi:hypothetical protein
MLNPHLNRFIIYLQCSGLQDWKCGMVAGLLVVFCMCQFTLDFVYFTGEEAVMFD